MKVTNNSICAPLPRASLENVKGEKKKKSPPSWSNCYVPGIRKQIQIRYQKRTLDILAHVIWPPEGDLLRVRRLLFQIILGPLEHPSHVPHNPSLDILQSSHRMTSKLFLSVSYKHWLKNLGAQGCMSAFYVASDRFPTGDRHYRETRYRYVKRGIKQTSVLTKAPTEHLGLSGAQAAHWARGCCDNWADS